MHSFKIAIKDIMYKGTYFLLFCSTIVAYDIPGGLTHVTASVIYLWGVNSADQIWRCARPRNERNWVCVFGALRQVDADDHEVWGVNAAHNIIIEDAKVHSESEDGFTLKCGAEDITLLDMLVL